MRPPLHIPLAAMTMAGGVFGLGAECWETGHRAFINLNTRISENLRGKHATLEFCV